MIVFMRADRKRRICSSSFSKRSSLALAAGPYRNLPGRHRLQAPAGSKLLDSAQRQGINPLAEVLLLLSSAVVDTICMSCSMRAVQDVRPVQACTCPGQHVKIQVTYCQAVQAHVVLVPAVP